MQTTIFKNVGFKLVLNICNIMVPILLGTYITRTLDIELFGIYNNVQVQMQLVLVVGGFGIYNYGLKKMSIIKEDKEKCKKLFTELFIISLLTNFLVGGILLLFIINKPSSLEKIIYLITSIQLLGNTIYIEWVNEAFEDYQFIAIKSIVVRIISVVLILIFVDNSKAIISYTTIMMLIYIINCLISFIYVINKVHFDFRDLNLRNHIKPLFTIFIITNVTVLYSQLDKIMLGHYVSDVSVTIYQIPDYIFGLINGLTLSIAVVSLPRLTYYYHNNKKMEYKSLFRKTVDSYLFLLIPAAFGVIALAKEIVLLYGGTKYLECTYPLVIFASISFVNSYNYIANNLILFVIGKERIVALISLVGGVFNIIMNYILIYFNSFSVISAAFTLGFSYLLVTILINLYLKYQLKDKVEIISKSILNYFFVAIFFIPISFVVDILIKGFYERIFVTILLCSGLYFFSLYVNKDYILLALIYKIKAIYRKFRNIID